MYKHDIENINASFFEIMTVLALWYFKKNKVDLAVLETGLGGRLDSVSACENKYLLFTSISMDHSDILGDSIQKIAQEKAKAINCSSQHIISITQNQAISNIINAL